MLQMTSGVNLKGKGTDADGVAFLRAEWWDPSSIFVLVHDSYKDHEAELGLRLDLDKKVFLDHMPDPNLDAEVQKRVHSIWKIVAHERFASD
jgi:hypothetical protein